MLIAMGNSYSKSQQLQESDKWRKKREKERIDQNVLQALPRKE